MKEITELIKQTVDVITSYFEHKYFLYLLGSIFLLGIVGQLLTQMFYGRLIKKADNMVSPQNKMLKHIKMKFENCKAVNGTVANPSLMVERCISKHKILGITLEKYSRIINVCAMMALMLGGAAAIICYEKYGRITMSVFYLLAGFSAAFAMDMFARCSSADGRQKELIIIITDFLENTMDCKEKRLVRAGETLEQMENEKFVVNFEPDVLHKELDGEGEMENINKLKQQEYIINEVLGEFLS